MIDTNKIIVSPNGVNGEIFSPNKEAGKRIRNEYEISDDDFVCGFAGSFGFWHGIDTIARSIKIAVEKIPNIKFLLVGDGELKPKLLDIIKNDNVENNVIFTGLIKFEEISAHLNACDVLMTPCKTNDDDSGFFNSPLKLFEYMATQKPTIASDVGQQSIMIGENERGYLIPERNPEALAEEIYNIYKNYDEAHERAKQARKFIINNYDWKQNIKRIYKAYKEVKEEQSI